MIGIYKILNKTNGKFYIGSSCNIEKRFNNHKSSLRRNRHPNIHLQRAWNKDGEGSFDFLVVEKCKIENLLTKEQDYIDNTCCYDFKIGYNIGRQSCGGDNLSSHPKRKSIIKKMTNAIRKRFINETQEEKEKRCAKVRGKNNPNFGNKWSDELKKRVSDKRKGKRQKGWEKARDNLIKWTTDSKNKEKMRQRSLGEKNPFYGKSHGDSAKSILSQKAKDRIEQKRNSGQPLAANAVRVKIDGVIYSSATEAGKKLNLNKTTVLNRCKNSKFTNYEFVESVKGIDEGLNEKCTNH